MKIRQIKLLLISLLLIGLHSCSNEETLDSENDPIVSGQLDVSKQSEVHQGLFEYARLMSLAIQKHDNMNELLQTETLRLERRGYYEQEFFVGMQGESEMKGFSGKSLNQILATVDDAKSEVNIKEFLNINPGMSVLLAGDISTDVFSNRVYVDNNFDDQDSMEVVHYYENGIMYTEPLFVERYKKSFVVRTSEVYMGVKTSPLSKVEEKSASVLFTYDDGRSVIVNAGFIETPNSKLYDDDDIYDPGSGPYEGPDDPLIDDGNTNPGNPGGGGNPCTATCERDCVNGTENLWRLRTTNDYDHQFLGGKGEWFFIIIWANDANYTIQNGTVVTTGSPLSYLRTGEIKVKDDNSWHTPNFSSIIWNPNESPTNPNPDGDRMKVICFESDGGSARNFQSTLSFKVFGANLSIPINFTINNGDDFIGEYIVDYCQDISYNGFIYHPAAVVDIQHNER
ncbi:hypothetical protein KORDIASMS9_01698 [Kordia sp. SMS9]|uniref:hypothetical protein n=1 Tax=Kordia sp. SMS9 TaxID=2282170 RepID=UPI000E109E93|nr:hypothetical protein [Kordia sp. SMS9]AXG69475.1 hypothetical protein KORDIASMS9_01698 [Kordia sp. SMS9]